MREEARVQHSVYYTSKALLDAETRYPKMEKWALSLVVVARKLKPYFPAYPIIVMIDQLLRQVLHKPEAFGHLVKWSMELREFEISYQPRTTMKALALANFVVECSEAD